MKNKILVLFILGMFLFSFASISAGKDNWGTTKQNNQITINQLCASASYMTLSTIQYPDKTINLVNSNMTYAGGGSFQYNFSDTSQLGTYDVCFISDGCESQESCAYFEVTPSGFIGTFGFYILLLILTAGVIVFGYAVEDAWVVVLGGFGLILYGLYVLFYGIDGLKDEVYTWGVGLITLCLGAYFAIRGSLEQIEG